MGGWTRGITGPRGNGYQEILPEIRESASWGLTPNPMNRRSFLVQSTVAVSAGLFSRSLLRAQTPPAFATTFTPLRRNVGLFIGRGGTMGWLAGLWAA